MIVGPLDAAHPGVAPEPNQMLDAVTDGDEVAPPTAVGDARFGRLEQANSTV